MAKIKGFTLLCTIILSSVLFVYGQKSHYVLSLLIKDQQNGQVLPGTTIKIGAFELLADDKGIVTYTQSTFRSFHALITHTGYDPLNIHFFPKQSMEKDTLYLSAADSQLQQVTIRGYSMKSGVNALAPATTLTASDLDKTRGANLAKILEAIPGLNILQTGNTIGKPVIDGLYGNRVLVINNGVKLEGQQWGVEHAPEIDPSLAQQITVVKGADGVRYGAEALGGAILLDPPPLPFYDSALHGEIALNGVSNGRGGSGSAMLSSSFRRLPALAWRLQGSYNKLGNFRAKDYFLENTGMEQKNFSGALGYQGAHFGGQFFFSQYQTSLGIFIGSDIGSVADLYARIHATGPFEKGEFSYDYRAPYQKVKHQLLKGDFYYNTVSGSRFEIKYNLQKDFRSEYDKRRSTRATIPITDLHLTTNTLEGSWQKVFAGKWHSTAGISFRAQSNYNDTITLANPVIPNYSANSVGLFGIERLSLNKKVELEAGMRFDYQAFNAAGKRYLYLYYDKDGNIVPNAEVPFRHDTLRLHGGYHDYGGDRKFKSFSFITGALWRPNTYWQVRSNLGLAWRAPNPEELYSFGLHQSVSSIEYGDSTLKSEQGYKWITTISKSGSRFDLNTNIYFQYIRNYIYLNPTDSFEQTVTGSYPVFRYLQTNALLRGIDLNAKYRFGNNGKLFEYELKASLLRANNLTKDTYLPFIPADRYTNSLQWNLPQLAKMTQNYLSVNYLYVTRQKRYTPNSDFIAPPSPYGLWGIIAGTNLSFNGGTHTLALNITVDNLFNIAYRDYMNRFRYYTEDIGRNIQLHAIFRF
ncbi:TonB-dependent receptor [Arachidicoccus ginsenosidivorans]|uniref:TonB-dependent receptor n=1 Tax=Arachidicoccus ginsenosidivorans TaxID=496057 RepID=A0A5B8VK71_9BACT|nr:TonB-dependent receptor [Arachidicoccus ginsenosidivorans]QEC70678.1 TonB-dependent receptor [Arachidicoccus ginsenosidivorans]